MRAVKPLVAFLAFAGIVIGLGSCNQFTPDVYGLSGKTFVYYSNGGHDKATYVFDSTGEAGIYLIENYTYCYSTKVDYDAGDISAKSWRQTSGAKGSFTYDATKFTYVDTPAEYYLPGSALIADAIYENYVWEPLLDILVLINPGLTSYSQTITRTMVFTTDNAESTAYTNIGGSIWANVKTAVDIYTLAGTKVVQTTKTTESCDINAGVINHSLKIQDTSTTNGAAGTPSTDITLQTFTVNRWLVVGETSDISDWAQSWTDGKKISFLADRTKLSRIVYEGSDVPTEPVITSGGTGHFYSGATGSYAAPTIPYYLVDTNLASLAVLYPGNPTLTFEHHGAYILQKVDSAGRSLFF